MITLSEAARRIGLSKQYIDELKNKTPRPEFFIEIDGKTKVDENHLAFKAMVARKGVTAISNINKSNGQKNAIKKKKGAVDSSGNKSGVKSVVKKSGKKQEEIDIGNDDDSELMKEMNLAAIKGAIASSLIKQEKAKQEEIKTAEMKKDLAPMYLIKHFFSFAESMLQRAYRRFDEISPELEALYRAGKSKEAVKLLLREQEIINLDAVKNLKKEIELEGFRYKKLLKEKKG